MTITITYRGDGDWGTGKGGNLTPAEVDANFWALVQAVEDLGEGPAPAEIATITLSGTQLTITLSDARVFGPYTLPLADPFSAVITEADATLTLSVDEAWAYVRCTNAGGCAVTVPTNAAVPIAIGTEFRFWQAGSGAIEFTGSGGVTLNLPDGASAESLAQGSVVMLKKIATDTWDVTGDLVGTGGGGGLSGGEITGPITYQGASIPDATSGVWLTDPNEYGSNFVTIQNEGAFQLLGEDAINCEMVFRIENTATAGTITMTFAKVTGDALTTTDGDAFIIHVTCAGGWTMAHVTKLT